MNDDQALAAIVKAYTDRGFPLDRGPGEVTITNLEGVNKDWTLNANTPNEFNDLRVCFTFSGGRILLLGKWESTTEPGRYWTEHPMDSRGAARAKLGYHEKVWADGVHHPDKPSGHEALVQVGEITVCRDLNKDFKRDGDQEYTGLFGINQHWGYDLPKKDLGTSSAGCMVIRMRPDHEAFMKAVKSDPRYIADHNFRFSDALFDARQVFSQPDLHHDDGLISDEAINLIVTEEIGSRAQYEAKYKFPEWPGGNSGVTIGIGYDIGAGVNSRAQLEADWKGLFTETELGRLAQCIGKTGVAGKQLLSTVEDIEVPWDAAMHVFTFVDVPRWYNSCKKILPNFEELPKDCKGALLSLAYNRGASFASDGDRNIEMRNIRAHMIAKEYFKIPQEFRSMKRLWIGQGLDGLLSRRDREAALFQRGLDKPKATEGAAGTVIAGGGIVVAKIAHDHGVGWMGVAGICIAAAIIAVLVFEGVNSMRKKLNEPVVTKPADPVV